MTRFLISISFIFIGIQILSGQIVWSDAIDISSANWQNHRPQIAIDAKGNPLVIWGGANKLMFSRWDGNAFIEPVQLNNNIDIAEASWMGPDIASKGDSIYIVFKQIPEGELNSHIWCMHSYDGGESFSSAVRVDNIDTNLSRFPAVATDELGNPIVAFMKFDSSFGEPHWVVSKSEDFGNSFMQEVNASGWSSEESEVCDCCPGEIVSNGENVAMLYRDNNNNLRDSWAGISNDGGSSFIGGMNIDQNNWNLFACPSSGPDGFMIGDTLYSTYMSGVSGTGRVYFSKSSLSDMTGSKGDYLTESETGVTQQNFPRIANNGNSAVFVWKQVENGFAQLALIFAEDITAGFSSNYEVIAMGNISNADVAISSDKVLVVWQDDSSGTVKFRTGSYSTSTSVKESILIEDLNVYPNPSNAAWHLSGGTKSQNIKIELYNRLGMLVYSDRVENKTNTFDYTLNNSDLMAGMYTLRFRYQEFQHSVKLIKK